MSKHTPGPWKTRLELRMNDGAVPVIIDGDRIALVDCRTPYKRGQGWKQECAERDANARLIAAAPMLLEALQAIVKADDSQELDQVLIEAGRRAIKAVTDEANH